MATVTLTLTDEHEDGEGDVNLTLGYDPPVILDTPTAAQEMAAWLVLRVRREFSTEVNRVEGVPEQAPQQAAEGAAP